MKESDTVPLVVACKEAGTVTGGLRETVRLRVRLWVTERVGETV